MLLAVLTCQSATECVKRHLPSWIEHSESMVFITTVDSHCYCPDGIRSVPIGRDQYADRDKPDDNLCRRTIQTLEWFLKESEEDSICLIEYDVVLFGRPVLTRDFSGTMFDDFIHCPWVLSRMGAYTFIQCGKTLLQHGAISGGWPDRHMRLMFDLIHPRFDLSANYSRNALDQPEFIERAREAVKNGAFGIHGCKTQEQFNQLTA